MNGGAADNRSTFSLEKISGWIRHFLEAVAEARIPPGRMSIVPAQGIINLMTSAVGIAIYTIAAQATALHRNLDLVDTLLMAAFGAILLFLAGIVVLFIARRKEEIVTEWNRTSSVFIIVWLLAFVVYILLVYPSQIAGFILLDKIAYSSLPIDTPAWIYDLTKSSICTLLAGLLLIYRTKRTDPQLSLRSFEPWLWLVLMTVGVGFVFFISLFYAP